MLAHGPTEGSEASTLNVYLPSTSVSVGQGCGVTNYFKVRYYGDGVMYARAWGGWSASLEGMTGACTPTPTPTHGPLTPPPARTATADRAPEQASQHRKDSP